MKTSVSIELSKIVYFLIISVWKILFRITNNRNWILAPLPTRIVLSNFDAEYACATLHGRFVEGVAEPPSYIPL